MVALLTLYPGKAEVEVAALQVLVYNIHHKRTKVTESLLVAVFPDAFQFFIVVLDAVEIDTFPGYPGLISIAGSML
jgi:hypothetical protein